MKMCFVSIRRSIFGSRVSKFRRSTHAQITLRHDLAVTWRLATHIECHGRGLSINFGSYISDMCFLACRGGTCPWWVFVVHCSRAPSNPTRCLTATPTADPTARQTRPQPTRLQRGPRPPRTTGRAGRL
jgi:hypothetical protein